MATKTEVNAGLFCELYWGTNLAEAWSFGPEQPQVVAAPDEKAPLPLYGFTLPEEGFLFAERTELGYRVYPPPAARLERSQRKDAFQEVAPGQLSQHEGRAYVELTEGMSLRITEGQLSLLVQPSVAKDRVGRHTLRDFAWLAMVAVLFLSAPVGFLLAGPTPERMAESNARALQAAREKEAQRRKDLGLTSPLRPMTDQERQQHQQQDGGARMNIPASLGVH
jgi:hypothetical protein